MSERPAAYSRGSDLSEELLDARVRHSSSGSDGAMALAVSNGFADRTTPLLFGRGTPRGGAAHANKRIHLVGDAAAAEQKLGVGLRLRVAAVTGLTDERLRPLVVEGVALGDLCLSEADGADLCIGHMARILARGELVK